MSAVLMAAVVFAADAQPGASLSAEDKASITALVSWIKAKGGRFRDVEITATPRGGRGVVARRDFKSGAVVSRTPFSALINIEHAMASPDLGSAISEEMDDLSDTTIMGAFLAYERARSRLDGAKPSDWAPYLASLPREVEMTTPLFYTPRVLDELRGSVVHGFVGQRVGATEANYERLSRTISDVISKEEFVWGLSILWSRTFGVKVKNSDGQWVKAPCFVPLADMFNTGSTDELNTDCRTTSDSRSFECFTTRAVRAGEELLVPYGTDLGNGQLLMDYGLVLRNNTKTSVLVTPKLLHFEESPYEQVRDFHKRVLEFFKLHEPAKLQFHLTRPTKTDLRYGVDPLPFPLPFLIYVRARTLDLLTLSGFKDGSANQQDIATNLRDNKPFSLEHEKTVVETLVRAFTTLQNAYTATLEEDTMRLAADDWCPRSYDARECAMLRAVVQLRTDEKLILRDSIAALNSYQTGLLKKWAKHQAKAAAKKKVERDEL